MIDKLPRCGLSSAVHGKRTKLRPATLFDRAADASRSCPRDHCPKCHGTIGVAWRTTLLLLATSSLLTGCSKVDSGDRVPLTGSISVNGLLLDVKGTIYFDPIAGQSGVGAAGEIKDSMFTIPAEEGLTPGLTYNVIVTTAPGIPAEGTPINEIRKSETYMTQVEIPSASGKEKVELGIDIVSETP